MFNIFKYNSILAHILMNKDHATGILSAITSKLLLVGGWFLYYLPYLFCVYSIFQVNSLFSSIPTSTF